MKLTVNEKQYWVEWFYQPSVTAKTTVKRTKNKRVEMNIEVYSVVTHCYIYNGQELIAQESAVLNPADQFVKETGRILSLERALFIGPWSADETDEFINQYKSRKKR
jgi:hypothetical protein